jgi:hypothetical protein
MEGGFKMELTPEEKSRIYQEERAKVEAQEKAKNEIAAENTKKGCMGCLVLIGIIIVLSIIFGSSCNNSSSNSTTKEITLNGSVRFTGTQFVITNNDNFDWENVKMSLNPGWTSYRLETSIMKAGETYTVGAAQFCKDDGERFNPFTHKPKEFLIRADTPDGEGNTGFEFN